MKISVVMTTYNGEKYLPEQLGSVRDQSRQPDEVLICDDCSSDRTCDIVADFIEDHGLDSWRFVRNETNKGWKRNFMDAIAMASGEIVFLCDQDDVWHRDKIKYMAQVSEKESGALLVICRYQKIKNSADISFRNPSGLYHREDNVSVGEYPGCCFCFRKSFFDRVKDARNEEAAHDLLIRMAAWMSDGIYICGDTLHYFRRHSGSATATGGWKSDAEDRKKYAGLVLDQYNALAKVIGEERVPTGYAEFLNMRYGMLKSGSAAEWFGILKYSRFYSQKKHIFADLLSILGKQNGGGEK